LNTMNTTIRNIDETVYRELKARAALTGKTIGEVLNEAIRAYLARPGLPRKGASLRQLHPRPYPDGNEKLSLEIDAIVYGI
jgi:plasmid stability protein